MDETIRPFHTEIAQSELDDLRSRLRHARWPEAETIGEWKQGVPIADMQRLVKHWAENYDWRRCEAMLNGWGQHITTIDGLDIHFLHIRSKHENALPLIMTHGWPGSVLEFVHVIGPLVDPVAHGGKAEDAFHLILPSCPGFAFSGKPAEHGWSIAKTAKAWAELMRRLGYDRYVAQGGDYGASITLQMAGDAAPGLVAYHSNLAFTIPTAEDIANADEDEKRYLAQRAQGDMWLRGYMMEQSTRPQTIGYALTDSPVGQAAWIYEKFRDWTTDCDGDPLNVFAIDDLLDNITLYWLTATAASSARLYWELRHSPYQMPVGVPIPAGYSAFQGETRHASRRWMERHMGNLVYWSEPPKGGHFAALQEPGLFVEEMRTFFGMFRA
ncbi:epoxide hydrolase family protein [Sphingomonas montanisoli]|uniref:Epoxide hydrolase n=1 Tax=Sphingomonas montanisoli TaxID=2606412 RepID=A0A5D9CAV6_9SPHN|nr:epoxide hydrolase family protein [Sphingomonas montanisoli]TZG28849.1 epoxide hydrolase [Sphingomonas montanisoli]